MTDKRQRLARRISTVLINRIGTGVLVLVIALVGVSVACGAEMPEPPEDMTDVTIVMP